jgi:ADP-ribose pyrophosphatase
MARVILVGALADPDLLSVVLGSEGRAVDGVLDLAGPGLQRLRYWLTAMGCDFDADDDGEFRVTTAPRPDLSAAELIAWAGVIMDYFPAVDPAQLARRQGHIIAQAAGRLRAGAAAAPAVLRRASLPKDVAVLRRHQPYGAYFAVEEIDFTHEKFLGGHGNPVRRAVFVSGDAVTVLPYDPLRDRVLLVEQIRSGPLVRGDANPWQLEAVAGRIDPGETPHQAALREAVEEAGLHLSDAGLRLIAEYYPSPGTSAEKLFSYLALVDLPDRVAGVHGLDSEDEDIKGHLVDFDQLMALVQSGEIGNAPTILSALWLARERPGLRVL